MRCGSSGSRVETVLTRIVLGVLVALSMINSKASPSDSLPPKSSEEGSVTVEDFFYYSCVHHYMRSHDVPMFDGSLNYAVEYVEADFELLAELSDAARNAAAQLPAPDYSDPEHGAPAVLVWCQHQSQLPAVGRIVERHKQLE
jgi:hypothetical protein